jgi:hypothetical protein
LSLMSRYSIPEFPVAVVNKAGKALVASQGELLFNLGNAEEVIDNWRSAHAYPAQSLYMTVKRHASKLGRDDGVAQRIKRMPSIVDKLVREPDMKLSQMQDIAGVRAVVKDVSEVRELEASLKRAGWAHAPLVPKDYIETPKASGYRGVHLKFKYSGEGSKSAYNGLKVEIQLRSQLQHQWATAVEAADAFTRQSLKQSRGDAAWKRFFALMSSVFALREGAAVAPNTPSTLDDLADEIWMLNEQHRIAHVFGGFTALLPRIEGDKTNSRYFLLTLDPVNLKGHIQAYSGAQAAVAQRDYTEAERRLEKNSPTQIVLVSTSSLKALRRVYPNYFLDTVEFTRAVMDIAGQGGVRAVEKLNEAFR